MYFSTVSVQVSGLAKALIAKCTCKPTFSWTLLAQTHTYCLLHFVGDLLDADAFFGQTFNLSFTSDLIMSLDNRVTLSGIIDYSRLIPVRGVILHIAAVVS